MSNSPPWKSYLIIDEELRKIHLPRIGMKDRVACHKVATLLDLSQPFNSVHDWVWILEVSQREFARVFKKEIHEVTTVTSLNHLEPFLRIFYQTILIEFLRKYQKLHKTQKLEMKDFLHFSRVVLTECNVFSQMDDNDTRNIEKCILSIKSLLASMLATAVQIR